MARKRKRLTDLDVEVAAADLIGRYGKGALSIAHNRASDACTETIAEFYTAVEYEIYARQSMSR